MVCVMRESQRKRWFHLGWWGVFVALLSLAACASPSGNLNKDPGIGLCETDADCTLQGQSCYRRYCRASSAVTGHRYSLQIIPPASPKPAEQNKLIRQQFLGIHLADIHDRPIWMRETFPIHGVVQTQKGQPIPAKLRFTDTETIPGQPLVSEVNNQEEKRTDGRFALSLTFGVYDIEVLPEDKRLPPFRIEKVSVTREQELTLTLPQHDLTSAEKDQYIRIQGRLLPAKSLVPLPSDFATQNLQVDVLSENGLAISGIENLGADGQFSIRLQTTVENIRLIAQPAFLRVRQYENRQPDDTLVWMVPELRIPLGQLAALKDRQIPLGDLPFLCAPKPGHLMGQIRSPQQEGASPCASCRLQLRGEISVGMHQNTPVQASYRFDTTSNSNGAYQIPYIEGRYELEVWPNVTSRWARAVFQSSSIMQNQMDITLEAKPDLRGRVCSKDEQGGCKTMVSGTQIRAVWRASSNPQGVSVTSETSAASQYQTQLSGKDGSFELLLDPGLYDLIFIPPTGSDLARKVERNLRVQRGQIELQTLLPKAQFLIAQIITPDGFPVEGATVELHAFQEGDRSPAHLIGRHTTNNLGMFSIPYDPSPAEAAPNP